jgi:hypothetical protein
VAEALLAGEATFLIRPALHESALRKELEQRFGTLNFKQIELHENLLKKAWLRALERQRCEPAKSFPLTSDSVGH